MVPRMYEASTIWKKTQQMPKIISACVWYTTSS